MKINYESNRCIAGVTGSEGIANIHAKITGGVPFNVRVSVETKKSNLWKYADNRVWTPNNPQEGNLSVIPPVYGYNIISRVRVDLSGQTNGWKNKYSVRGVNNRWSNWTYNGHTAKPKGVIGVKVKQIQMQLFYQNRNPPFDFDLLPSEDTMIP